MRQKKYENIIKFVKNLIEIDNFTFSNLTHIQKIKNTKGLSNSDYINIIWGLEKKSNNYRMFDLKSKLHNEINYIFIFLIALL